MLNVGIVFDGVADDVVDVMGSLPPSDTHAPKDVTYHDTYGVVDTLHMGDTIVTRIMTNESKLLPEAAQEATSEELNPCISLTVHNQADGQHEETPNPGGLLVVEGHIRLEESPLEQILPQLSHLLDESTVGGLGPHNVPDVVIGEFFRPDRIRVVLLKGIGSVLAKEEKVS